MITIILTVVLIMGPGKKDVDQNHEMTSISECFDAAKAWDEQYPAVAGGVGLAAGCSVTEDKTGEVGFEE